MGGEGRGRGTFQSCAMPSPTPPYRPMVAICRSRLSLRARPRRVSGPRGAARRSPAWSHRGGIGRRAGRRAPVVFELRVRIQAAAAQAATAQSAGAYEYVRGQHDEEETQITAVPSEHGSHPGFKELFRIDGVHVALLKIYTTSP